MIHLSAWLRPPRFADEEKTRQAFLLNIILWVLIIVPIPFLVYTQLFSPEAWRRVLTQVLSGEAVNVFLLVLLRRGYVRIASIIQIAAFWAFFTATAWTGAGIYTQAYQIGQALVICIAGFLIGVHGALIMVGVSLLSGGLMVAAADMGWWSFNPPDKALTVWVVSAVLFPVLAVLQYLAGRLLRTALAQSRMSQAQYRNLVQHIPLRIFIKDLNSVYVSCNSNYARDLGIEPEQIVGKDDFAFYGRELAEGYRADDRAVVGGEARKEVEEKYVVSGQELWIHTIKVPYRDHEGHVVGVLGIFEDITDRRRAEEMLRGSEERFRSLVETTSDWIWETDAENRYTYASPQSRDLLGYEPEEIIGRKPFDLMTPEEAERVWAEFERPRSAKRPFHNLENVNLRKDGRKVVLETSGVPRLDSHGNFLGYRGIDRDITERKRAEEALQRSQQLFSSIFRTNPAATILSGLVDGRCVDANEAYAKLVGYTREELIGKTTVELSIWISAEERQRVVTELARKGHLENVELSLRKKNGDIINTVANGEVFTLDGQRYVLSFFFDITERKRAEEALKENQALLKTIIESTPDYISMKDREGRYVMVNSAAAGSLSLSTSKSAAEVIGKKDDDIFPSEVARRVMEEDRQVITFGEIRSYDQSFTIGDEPRTFSTVKSPCLNPEGTVIGVVSLSRDITDRKRAEEELRRSHDELEMRVQERTEELQTINEQLRVENEERLRVEFELRESENRLRELSTALLSAQERERKLIAQEIHDSLGASLAATKFKVETVLTEMGDGNPQIRVALASVIPIVQGTIEEARRIQMSLRPSMLDDLGILPTINWSCRQFESIYPAIRITKEIDIEEDEVPKSLKIVIYRILQEALNNIAKHSKTSVVLLFLRKTDQAIQLEIRDRGQGFNSEEAHSRKGATRGLGLDSMKERTELSGGSLDIESAEGKGTTIFASWPLGRNA